MQNLKTENIETTQKKEIKLVINLLLNLTIRFNLCHMYRLLGKKGKLAIEIVRRVIRFEIFFVALLTAHNVTNKRCKWGTLKGGSSRFLFISRGLSCFHLPRV